MAVALTGHAVESGIAVGKTHIIARNELDIGEYRVSREKVDDEVSRLRAALAAALEQLSARAREVRDRAGEAAEEIILTHVAMLSDSSIADEAERHIRDSLCNAEWALQLKLESLLAEFRGVDDDYLRTRSEDVTQVIRLVQGVLSEATTGETLGEMPDRLVETITVAAELTPGELALLHARGVAGIVTEHGSPHSHTAILARSLGIPAVVGVHRAQSLLRESEPLILDGHYGVVFAEPGESITRHYLRKQAKTDRYRRSLDTLRDVPTRSRDGVEIRLVANAQRPEEMREAVQVGALGVGLFRTEFLYLEGPAPNEEEQLARYREALAALDGRPLTIRTLDLGADKGADLLDLASLRHNPNPALGLRAVRLCLRERDLFRAQLRAILRCSALGPVRCLIPMLTSVSELRAVRALLAEAREELDAAGQAYDPDLPLGGMIEVPAAALAIDDLAPQVDFLSVGTNDLVQYALAADRADEQVAHLYDPRHPGVIQLLRHIFRGAERHGVNVAVCGEMAGDRRYTRLLLALGLREFSLHPRYLLEVKQVILDTDVARARERLETWFDTPAKGDRPELLAELDIGQGEV